MTNLKNRKVLVTGGAGFIGSELVRQLADEQAVVIAVDNLASGHKKNLEGITGNPQFVQEDIRQTASMERLLKGVEVVFHLACLGVRHSIHSPYENHQVNAEATLKLLQISHTLGVKRFVTVSSSEVYGTAQKVPMDENHPTFPHTVYGASKLAGECYTRAFHDTYGFPTVVIRPFNTYGPRCHHEGDSGEVIPKFLLRTLAGKPMMIFGDGTQTRDFTYVADTARGILTAGLREEAVGETINLGSGFEITVNALAQKIREATGFDKAKVFHDQPRPGDVLRLYADSQKAKKLLGFEPRVTLKEGLVLLKNWYASLSQSPEELLEKEIVRNWEKVRSY